MQQQHPVPEEQTVQDLRAQSQPHKFQASNICSEPKTICIYYWIDFPHPTFEKIARYSWETQQKPAKSMYH